MNRKSTLNQKRSATISEFRFITEENTEANALLQQEQQQPKLKQDQSLLQQHKRTQSQTKLTKVLPYKVTRSKSVHAFQEYGKGFVGSPLMNSSIKSSQINLPQSKKLIKTNNTFATNSSNNFANSNSTATFDIYCSGIRGTAITSTTPTITTTSTTTSTSNSSFTIY